MQTANAGFMRFAGQNWLKRRMKTACFVIGFAAFLALVTGCGTAPRLKIDSTSYESVSQDSRAQHLILHFTTIDNRRSIEVLTRGLVSAHYLVTEPEDGVPPKIYQFVPDHRRAFHAGVSFWKGAAGLNASSIGIEIVSKGYTDTPQGRVWHDFPKEQMDLVIELVKKIVREHQIRPERILGHSDIAPGRKNDPGPKFPWQRFADEGLIPWPDAQMVQQLQTQYANQLPDIAWFQQKLTAHGFYVPVTGNLDGVTRAALEAFQMKYRPSKFDGQPDAQTAALLDVVTGEQGFRVNARGEQGRLP
jgi:N-acetylmuramoyl-L-alanine amidase